VTYVGGKVDQAFQFDGIDSVEIPDHSDLEPAQITLDGWIKPNFSGRPVVSADVDIIIEKAELVSSVLHGYMLFVAMDSGFLYFECGMVPLGTPGLFLNVGGTQHQICGSSPLPNDNAYHNVVGTYDGATMRLFVDGVLVVSKTVARSISNATTAAAFIGRENVTPRNTLAAIDEVEIFSRALTGPASDCGADPNNEICDIFLADSAGKCKPGTPFTCDGTLYQTTAPSLTGPYTLYEVQTSPVQLLAIGSSFSLGTEFNALGYNPVDDYLYAINGLSPFQLYRIDASATVTNLGNVTGMVAPSGQRFNAGTFGPGGQYYVMSNLATPKLYRIDISTRVATLIGSPAVNRILDIAYNSADGQLYGRRFFNTGSHNTGQLFKIDPTTAAATAIGGVTKFGRTGAIYFTALGEIIGVHSK